MDNSIFLAQLLGPLFSIIGISILINENSIRKVLKDIEQNYFLVFFSGLISLFF